MAQLSVRKNVRSPGSGMRRTWAKAGSGRNWCVGLAGAQRLCRSGRDETGRAGEANMCRFCRQGSVEAELRPVLEGILG